MSAVPVHSYMEVTIHGAPRLPGGRSTYPVIRFTLPSTFGIIETGENRFTGRSLSKEFSVTLIKTASDGLSNLQTLRGQQRQPVGPTYRIRQNILGSRFTRAEEFAQEHDAAVIAVLEHFAKSQGVMTTARHRAFNDMIIEDGDMLHRDRIKLGWSLDEVWGNEKRVHLIRVYVEIEHYFMAETRGVFSLNAFAVRTQYLPGMEHRVGGRRDESLIAQRLSQETGIPASYFTPGIPPHQLVWGLYEHIQPGAGMNPLRRD